MMMVMTSYSARNESNVVMVPVPAISGNATGTMDAVAGISSLWMRIPKIISSAMKKSTSEPAMANEERSSPRNFSRFSPMNRNMIMMPNDTSVAFSEWMLPACLRICISTGMEPMISMTAKRIMDTVTISLMLRFTVGDLKIQGLKARKAGNGIGHFSWKLSRNFVV